MSRLQPHNLHELGEAITVEALLAGGFEWSEFATKVLGRECYEKSVRDNAGVYVAPSREVLATGVWTFDVDGEPETFFPGCDSMQKLRQLLAILEVGYGEQAPARFGAACQDAGVQLMDYIGDVTLPDGRIVHGKVCSMKNEEREPLWSENDLESLAQKTHLAATFDALKQVCDNYEAERNRFEDELRDLEWRNDRTSRQRTLLIGDRNCWKKQCDTLRSERDTWKEQYNQEAARRHAQVKSLQKRIADLEAEGE